MVYGKKLRKMFNGVTLKLEDLYVLEPFQIESLKTMAPRKEFAALMFAHPNIKDFFINKQPSMADYIKEIQEIFGPETNKKILSEFLDYFLWEIAILIIYNKYPHQLSGGMAQRVLIALALSCQPALLIADEPTTSLDATTQILILKLLKELQQQHGFSMMLISHDKKVVNEMSDSIIKIDKGKLV